jgi:EAL domain-containing protein (putative c-di-GMP-specific phosphodiesterase class I)
MIVPIGEWVLEQACRQLVRWSEEFPHRSKVWMAVNLSARQISQPDFAERAAEILGRTGVDPGLVELEITESLLMLDTAESKGVLASLTRLGMRLSVDDFGTGYSSLSYLKRFPVHKLKIDRSFVRGIAADDDDSAIVEAILALSRSVGLMSVAEGIESRDQLKVLHRLGCPEGQGNFFSKPQPPEALRGLMAMPDITDLLTGSIA